MTEKTTKPLLRWKASLEFDFKYDIEGSGGAYINRDGSISNLWASEHYPYALDGKGYEKEAKPELFDSVADVASVFRSALRKIPADGTVRLGEQDYAMVFEDNSGLCISWDADKFDNYPIFGYGLKLKPSRKTSRKKLQEALDELLRLL